MNIAHHIDSILMILFGAYFTFRGFRQPLAGWTTKLFRFLGPFALLIGLLLLLVSPAPSWVVQTTDDNLASAEFPGSPTRKESVDVANGVSLPRITYNYTVPAGNISLSLSRSPLLNANLTDEERIDSMLSFFAQHGFTLSTRESVQCGELSGYSVKLYNAQERATLLIRFVLANNNVYRALASFTTATEEQDEIQRFITSFRVRPAV